MVDKAAGQDRKPGTPIGSRSEQPAGRGLRDAGVAGRELALIQQRQRLLRRILQDIRAAVTVEEAVERAMTALGRELGASEVVVRIGTEAELLTGLATGSRDRASEQGGGGD